MTWNCVLPKLPKALLGDRKACAARFAEGLLEEEEEVSMRNADLNDIDAMAVAQRLGERIRSLDLYGNRIGGLGCEALAQARASNLLELSLAKNGLADSAVSKLCVGLCQKGAPRLQKLSLAENQISRGGRAVGRMLEAQKQITFLDLHWNLITGDGALGLFQGISSSALNGGALLKLDLSWNCVGNSMATQSMDALSACLVDGCPLVHLDLSYNGIPAEACKVLGEGLRKNHTLMGLHLVGNEASVDANGFVVAAASSSDPQVGRSPRFGKKDPLLAQAPAMRKYNLSEEERSAIRAAFRKVDTDGSGTVEAAELHAAMKALSLSKSEEEVQRMVSNADKDGNGQLDIDEFTALIESAMLKQRYERDQQRSRQMEMDRDRSPLEARTSCWICESWQPIKLEYKGQATAVWAFTSLDNFEHGTQLTEDRPGCFACQRMVPPDVVWVYLQVDNDVCTVPGLAETRLPVPIQHRLREAEGLEPQDVDVDVTKVSIVMMGADTKQHNFLPRPAACTVVLSDPSDPMQCYVLPRMSEAEVKVQRKGKPWDFKDSIFARWRFESPQLHANALALDWQYGKASRFIKSSKELEGAQAALKNRYSDFLRLYRSCAAKSYTGSRTFGISRIVASELFASCGVIDEATCKSNDIDRMFIAARVRDKGAANRPFLVKPSDVLLRYQFLELLVRVANAKYCTAEEVSVAEALDRLFAALAPAVMGPDEDLAKFLSVLHSQDCDTVLKKHEPLLRCLFSCHSGRFSNPGEEPRMSCEEFMEFLVAAGAYTEAFTERDACYAFQMGSQLYPDELFSLDFSAMGFLEYLHGVCAAVYLRQEPGVYAGALDDFLAQLAERQGCDLLRVLR